MDRGTTVWLVFFIGDDYYAKWQLDAIACWKSVAMDYVDKRIAGGAREDQFEIVKADISDPHAWQPPERFRQ